MWAETVASTNFGTPVPRTAFIEALETYNTQKRLNALPPTPTMNPGLLDVGEWRIHEKELFTENTDNWLKTWKTGKVGSSSTSVEIPSHFNKYESLEVD